MGKKYWKKGKEGGKKREWKRNGKEEGMEGGSKVKGGKKWKRRGKGWEEGKAWGKLVQHKCNVKVYNTVLNYYLSKIYCPGEGDTPSPNPLDGPRLKV